MRLPLLTTLILPQIYADSTAAEDPLAPADAGDSDVPLDNPDVLLDNPDVLLDNPDVLLDNPDVLPNNPDVLLDDPNTDNPNPSIDAALMESFVVDWA